jgi:peptidoglycan-associated lipoprotein
MTARTARTAHTTPAHRPLAHACRALLLALGALLAVACGGPPQEALDGAERELLNAAFAKDCAEDTYRAAQRMLDEAKAASAAGNYDEARRKADASRMLSEQAKADAQLNREECDRRKAALNAVHTAPTFNPPPPPLDSTFNNDLISGDYILKAIYFPFDEATLTAEAQRLLNEHAAFLQKNPSLMITIEGHTDDTGSNDYNMALSQHRAQVVKQHLQRLGVEANRLKTVPYGEERPAAYGGGEDTRAKNRRAEFVKR